MAEVVIDDFEDGDVTISATGWTGWSEPDGDFTASSSTVISGSFSGRSDVPDDFTRAEAVRDSSYVGVLQAKIEIESQLGNSTDDVEFEIFGENALGSLATIRFVDNGDVEFVADTTTVIGSWTAGTTYRVAIRTDGTDVYAYLDGVETGPVTPNSNTEILELRFENDTRNDGSNRYALIDDVIEDPVLNAPTLSIDSQTDATTDFSWTNVSDEGGYELYRSASSPVTTSDTLVDTVGADVTTTSDTSPDRDQVWYYAIRATGAGEYDDSPLSNEVTTQEFGDPTIIVDDTRDSEIDLSVTYPPNAEEIDIYRAETSGVNTGDTFVTTLTGGTTHTDTSLENGEQYFYVCQARDTDGTFTASELSNEVSPITTLPAPTVDSSTADSTSEITLNWTLNDNSTDGDVDIVRDNSVLGTVAIGTTTFQDSGLTEATSYDYEIRRNTDHASTDSAVDTQFTQPNAPTGASATAQDSDVTVDLSWTDNSAGEDNYEIEENRDSSGFSNIATEPDNTTSFTTSKKDRVSTYEFRVRATVGSGDSFAGSSYSTTNTVSFTTYDNYWCTVTPPGGTTETFQSPHVSYVDLEHTAIHGAGVILGNIDADIANWGPKTDIQIYLDDERIFAGEMIRLREDTPNEGQTDTTAKGPVKELENAGPTSAVSYSDTLAYLAIDDYFTNQITGIDVDATVYAPPETTVENDTLLLSADSVGYPNLVTTDLTDVPITASGSYLIEETAFIGVEDDFGGLFTTQADSPGSPPYHISQEWAELGNNDTVSYTFTPEHDIPSERVGVAAHLDVQDGAGTLSTLSWTFNGDDLDATQLLNPNSNRWVNLPNDYAGADLTAGNNYTMDIDAGDFALDVDALVVYDKDYVGGTFTDITSFGGTLDNPVPYNPVEIDIENEARPNAIKSGRVDATVSNIGGDFRHRVSVTGEASELTSTNADDTFNFFTNSQYGTIFEPFLRLDGQGSDTTFSSGVNAQEVTQLDYYLTTVDTEVIEELQLTGSHFDNLQQLHQLARFNFVTDPRFDPDIDGIVIESFLPGSSDSQKTVDWTTIDVDVEREFDGYANAVSVVYEDTNGDTQTFVGAADSAEVASVGATVRKVIFDPSVSTIDEARIASEREKRRRIANDSTSGDIEAVASFTLPGYSYDITEFGGYTTLAGRVSYRESADDVTMSLQFKADKDNVQRLLDTQEELEQVEKS